MIHVLHVVCTVHVLYVNARPPGYSLKVPGYLLQYVVHVLVSWHSHTGTSTTRSTTVVLVHVCIMYVCMYQYPGSLYYCSVTGKYILCRYIHVCVHLYHTTVLLYVWDEQKLSKSIILNADGFQEWRSEIWKKFFSGICKSKYRWILGNGRKGVKMWFQEVLGVALSWKKGGNS